MRYYAQVAARCCLDCGGRKYCDTCFRYHHSPAGTGPHRLRAPAAEFAGGHGFDPLLRFCGEAGCSDDSPAAASPGGGLPRPARLACAGCAGALFCLGCWAADAEHQSGGACAAHTPEVRPRGRPRARAGRRPGAA